MLMSRNLALAAMLGISSMALHAESDDLAEEVRIELSRLSAHLIGGGELDPEQIVRLEERLFYLQDDQFLNDSVAVVAVYGQRASNFSRAAEQVKLWMPDLQASLTVLVSELSSGKSQQQIDAAKRALEQAYGVEKALSDQSKGIVPDVSAMEQMGALSIQLNDFLNGEPGVVGDNPEALEALAEAFRAVSRMDGAVLEVESNSDAYQQVWVVDQAVRELAEQGPAE